MSNDADMTDAAPGADANGSNEGEEFVHEKQRLKIVRREHESDFKLN